VSDWIKQTVIKTVSKVFMVFYSYLRVIFLRNWISSVSYDAIHCNTLSLWTLSFMSVSQTAHFHCFIISFFCQLLNIKNKVRRQKLWLSVVFLVALSIH